MIAVADAIDAEGAVLTNLQTIVSPSRLSLFLHCRLKFWFRYVAQIEKPKSLALHLGSSVHSTLKAWNKARWRGLQTSRQQLREDLVTGWKTGEFQGGDDEDKQINLAWSLVETYLREQPFDLKLKPDAVEVPVEADLKSHGLPKLVGVLDLVQSGSIVDYKTSATTPAPERSLHLHEAQITAYSMLFRSATGSVESGVEIHTLVKLKTPKLVVAKAPPASEPQRSRLFRLIESYVDGLERRDWVPSRGLQCSACEYFRECSEWKA